MSQLVARTALRALLVRGGGNCNMFVRSVSAASVIKSPENTKKPVPIHDWCGDFNIRSKHVQENSDLKWKRMSSASAMEKKDEKPTIDTVKKDENGGGSVAVPSYWGIETAKMKITRRDGSEWPWNSFTPWETYQADLSIDLKKHHVPKNIADKIAYGTVKLLRIPTDIFFQA